MPRRCVAVFAALCVLILGGCDSFSSSQNSALSENYKNIIFEFEQGEENIKYYYKNLTETEKAAYINILNAAENFDEKATVPTLNTQSLSSVTSAVVYDNPELFWLSSQWEYTGGFGNASVKIPYAYSKDECEKMKERLEDEISTVLKGIRATMTDYEKELYIHDSIVKTCQYSQTAVGNYEKYQSAYTAYGALVEKSAICEGYSKAAKILLSRVGIDSFLITGTGTTETGEKINHMWNIVTIGGFQYHLDLTWDDPLTGDGEGVVRHSYFNLNNEEISADHSFDIPVSCTQTTDNYFRKNNMFFSFYTENAIISRCAEKIFELSKSGDNLLELRFSNREAYETAVSKLFDEKLIYVCVAQANNHYGIGINISSVYCFKTDSNYTIGFKLVIRK